MNKSMYPRDSVGPHKYLPVLMLKPKNALISVARIVKTSSSKLAAAELKDRSPAGGCQVSSNSSRPTAPLSGFKFKPHITTSVLSGSPRGMDEPIIFSPGYL